MTIPLTDPFKSMNSRVILVAMLLGLASACSCSQADHSLEERRQNAIQFIQQYHSTTKNPVLAKLASDALAALKAANVTTLKRPLLAAAVIVVDEKQACRLHLFWIEDHPSIDAVELKYGGNPPMRFSIPNTDLKDNLNESIRTVLYKTGYNWDTGTDFATRMSQRNGANDLAVRLLQTGKPITDWSPVDIYKVDRWVTH